MAYFILELERDGHYFEHRVIRGEKEKAIEDFEQAYNACSWRGLKDKCVYVLTLIRVDEIQGVIMKNTTSFSCDKC